MNRQLYQMGGIGSLPMDYGQSLQVPQQMQPSFSSAQNITMNPLLNYGQTPLTMAGGGSTNLVEREKYGLGSVLKKFAKTFIPKELDPVLQFAAPFLGPVYGPIASIAGSARTGKINPLSLAASTLPYVRFGGVEGATGLQSLMPTGYGGSGALGQFLPGGDLQVGSGRSLSNVLSDYMKVGTPSSTGNVSFEMGPDGLKLPGTSISDAMNIGGTQPGTVDLFKTVFSPDSNIDLGTRARAAADLTGSAIKAMYTNADGSVDKRMIIATISGASTYLDAKKKADQAGLTANEFNEQIYNEEKAKFSNTYQTNLNPSSFGIRPTAADGGMMSDDGLLSIKLTPREGYLFGNVVRANGVAESFNGPIPSGLVFNMNEGGGGIGTLIKRIISTNPNMFQQTQQQPRAVSTNPVNDLYKYYLENGTDEDYKRRIMESVRPRFGIAMGGEIPTRQNPSGVTELDMRAKGGYIPVGIKEKADDVPAMLSKNEFVFTADAVRGAGDGSINKGAQKMYKLMKSLEKKINKTKVK